MVFGTSSENESIKCTCIVVYIFKKTYYYLHKSAVDALPAGCGNVGCTNVHCATCAGPVEITVAAARALELVNDFDGPADNDAADAEHPLFKHCVVSAAAAVPMAEGADDPEEIVDKDDVAAAPMAEEADEPVAFGIPQPANDDIPSEASEFAEPEVPKGPTLAEQLPAIFAKAKAESSDTAAREAVWNLFHSYVQSSVSLFMGVFFLVGCLFVCMETASFSF